jgi:hypothetical protein
LFLTVPGIIICYCFKQIRSALVYAPEDPNNLHQVMPPNKAVTSVARIKGNRWPSPGSVTGARVPLFDSTDRLYNSNYVTRDPRNTIRNVSTYYGPFQFFRVI